MAQRRRANVVRVAALAVGLLAAHSAAATPDGQQPLLPRGPFVGLHCGVPTYPCRSVGIAVWVLQPVRSVEATLDRHTVTLRTRVGGSGMYSRGRFWHVFFRDANAQALADAGRSIPVTLHVITRAGKPRTAQAIVYVSEGYG
jgi:hypothetical protein